jgi:hypothetical protein
MNKVSSIVPLLAKLSEEISNIDDISQVYNDITNTMDNLLTVNRKNIWKLFFLTGRNSEGFFKHLKTEYF